MTTALFIVLFARDKWWIDLNGKSRGPFETREIAETDAIALAKAYAQNGRRAEVQVVDPNAPRRVAWQSDDKSFLVRSSKGVLAEH
ncbi:MAG: hypothetical protein ABI697_07705 [Devosia sp.]